MSSKSADTPLFPGEPTLSRSTSEDDTAREVMHEIGNLLNSLSTSTTVLARHLDDSRIDLLYRVVKLIDTHADELPTFFRDDPRGHVFPEFMRELAKQLSSERDQLQAEVNRLHQHVDLMRTALDRRRDPASAQINRELVHLPPLVEFVLSVFASDVEREAITVSTEVAPERVRLDTTCVQQILINLLRNAIHALSARDRQPRLIEVRARTDDAHVIFEVQDSGCGIHPDHRARVFDRGFTTKPQGHGLGLHTSQTVARAMNGTLTVDSPGVDQGTIFRLSLPYDGFAR